MTDIFKGRKVTSIELSDLNTDEFNPYFENQKTNKSIDHIDRINIFIGPNNTGKSRLMRTLANTQPQRFAYDLPFLERLPDILKNMQSDFDTGIAPKLNHIITLRNAQGQEVGLSSVDFSAHMRHHFEVNKHTFSGLISILEVLCSEAPRISNHSGTNLSDWELPTILQGFRGKYTHVLEELRQHAQAPKPRNVCYIPAFRGLNGFGVTSSTSGQDFIANRVREHYHLDEHVDIFTGVTLFSRIRQMLLGDREERDKVKDYENFLSRNFFDNQEVTLIPKEKADVIDVNIGGTERRIYDLGDGLQALIILTFPLFEYEECMFFIEEPEVNLHPGMQRKLLSAFQEKPEHQIFLTSHSNHFLDLTIQYENVSVYLCRKEDSKCQVRLVAFGDRTILEEIGVQNTSVFLTNKTVWIEGITDRLYLAKYLELYIKKNSLSNPITEDQDYSYVEYGGGNITHWSFLELLGNDRPESSEKISAKRLCAQMILIADKDKINTKIQRKKLLKEQLGEYFIELPVREIENLLTPRILELVITDYESAELNVLQGIKQEDMCDVLLGTYIDDKFKSVGRKSKRGSYAAPSGTIKDKVAFCHKALDCLTDFDDLSPEAKNLTRKIYSFIAG